MDSKALLVLLIMAGTAAASDVTVYAYDLNTRGGIPSAEVNLMLNQTYNLTTPMHTDAYGTLVYAEPAFNYTLRINQTGYIQYEQNVTLGTFSQITAYLYPSNSAGIIRVRFQDMTIGGSDRQLCIFFVENGRLYECVKSGNETAVLLTQHNYTIVPTITKADLLSGTSNLKIFLDMYGGTVISGGALLLAAAVTVIYLLWHQWKK